MRIVGTRARRIEDPALLRGAGRYADDIELPGLAHAAFVRSPHAHALIRSIDSAAARAMPEVVAVLTAKDLEKHLTRLRMPLGFPSASLPDHITPFVLTPREACFVGEAVAMVIAESRQVAEDAAAAVSVDCEPLPAVVNCVAALDPKGPPVRQEAPSNVLTRFNIGYGDCARAFGGAAHVFKETLSQHRGGAHPIEGRGVVARYEAGEDRMTVWSSTQMAHDLWIMLADLLGMAEDRIRVAAPDVGGGFGAKFLVYPEEIAVPAAARLLGRPVKWIEDRLEHFLASIQERDQYWDMELAVDSQARILGLRGRLAVVGVQQVRDAAKRGKLKIALVASDASQNSLDKITGLLEARRVPLVHAFSAAELGEVAGREAVAVVGVTDAGLAAGIKEVVF